MTATARRDQLLDACGAIVDTEGFTSVTIDRVATECGVTRTVVYQQFGGLDGMLDALVQRSTVRAASAIEISGPDEEEPSLRAVMEGVLKAVDSDPATWRMFLVAPRVGPAALAENLDAGRALIRARNEAVIDSRSAPGGQDPELTARMLQAMGDELVRLRLADPSVYTTERILDQVERLGALILGPEPQR
jgi:AcrR family transcriptional regulator